MNNDSYNDYIRSVLGNNDNESLKYPDEDKSYYCDYSHPKNNMQGFERQENSQNQYDYQNNYMQNYNLMYSDYQNRFGMPDFYNYGYYPNGYNYTETRNNSEIEECYPEIYGIVYPMVKKACRNITEPVTKADVEKMVEELYGSLEENKQEVNNRARMTKQPNKSTGLFKPNVEPKREVPITSKVEQVTNMRNTKENLEILERAKETPKETRYCNNGLCDIIRILLVRELLNGPNRPPFGPGPRPPFPPPFRPGPNKLPYGPGPRPFFF